MFPKFPFKFQRTALLVSVLALGAGSASAAVLEGVGTFEGNAGIGTSNGDVTDSPAGNSYVYISTADSGHFFNGLNIGEETNGTVLTTNPFNASTGDELQYYFNYVASDGTEGYVEYAYAQLNTLNSSTGELTDTSLIFTARTTPVGNTVPGFGLPALDDAVSLDPGASPIMPGSGGSVSEPAPLWGELGIWSGQCFGDGCGLTGWIEATLALDEGTYSLTFGVVNWEDELYNNGLAIAGLSINGDNIIDDGNEPEPVAGIPPVPLPAGAWLMLTGLGGVAAMRRRKKRVS